VTSAFSGLIEAGYSDTVLEMLYNADASDLLSMYVPP